MKNNKTEHKRATKNDDVKNHIAEHHLQTEHQIDWTLRHVLRIPQSTKNNSLKKVGLLT